MSSVLSEISNRLQISSIKDAVTDIYDTMFHKLNKVKDVFSKPDPEMLPKIIKEAAPVKDEGYVSPAKPKTPGEIIKATLTNIKDVVWDYGFKFIVIAFYIMLASLVANDMIIYAAPIRAFFFLFTLFFTSTIFPCAIAVAFYYLLKKGYDYYNQNLSSATVKPPLCFPMIFAILPLTTYYPTSPFVRFFLWIFMYQKSDKPGRMEKENKRLEIIMSQYWNDLNGSFEYLDKIKDTPPFKDLYEIIEKKLTIEGMHPIQQPEKVLELSKTSDAIGEENKKEEKKEKVQFFKPQDINQSEKKKEEEKEAINATANTTSTNAAVTNNTATKATNGTVTNSTANNTATATNSTTNNTSTKAAVTNNTATKTTNSTATNNTATNSTLPVEPAKVEPAKATNGTVTNNIATKVEPAKAEPAKAEPVAPMPPTI